MAAGFKVRRIRTENSIGDRLKKARTRKKISVAEVEENTKIRAKFILALESDSWEQIPSEVYGRGYLERYAEFLQLPTIMAQFDRERSMYSRTCQEGQVELAPQSGLRMPKFFVTPRFFVGLVIVAGIAVVGSGVIKQIVRFTSAPALSISVAQAKQSNDGTELLVTGNSLTITGQTAIGATVTVNGVMATVQPDGRFSGTVAVQKGLNAVLIEAVSAQDKKTTDTLSVVVK